VVTRAIDLGEAQFGDLPDDFDYVLHLSAHIHGNDYDRAITVNAEGTALLMAHCRGVLLSRRTAAASSAPARRRSAPGLRR
jgi:hypothetical protein